MIVPVQIHHSSFDRTNIHDWAHTSIAFATEYHNSWRSISASDITQVGVSPNTLSQPGTDRTIEAVVQIQMHHSSF